MAGRRAKLGEEERQRVRTEYQRADPPVSREQLAMRYSVSLNTIHRILRGVEPDHRMRARSPTPARALAELVRDWIESDFEQLSDRTIEQATVYCRQLGVGVILPD